MTRTILHLDLDAFYCAVEIQRDPSLDGKPFAVGGQPDQRGVVASCSYQARRFGIHSAMPMSRAVQLCPDLIIVSRHDGKYGEASREVMARLKQVTPFVEQISIDEAFLDVTGLPEAGLLLARRLQAEIREEPGLPCSFGIATNKLVAKIANTVGKSKANTDGPPNAISVVLPGREARYLSVLPVNALWGIGPKTGERLNRMGVKTIGDLAKIPEARLVKLFGKLGADLARRSRGIDDHPIITEHEAKSISRETTFVRDVNDAETLYKTLRQLSDGVGWRLRRAGLTGKTISIKLRWTDFSTITRQLTLHHPVDQDSEIYQAARQLFEQAWVPGRKVRLIGVGVSGFETTGRQLSLWEGEQDKQDRHLQSTLDELRERFGERIVKRGSDLE